MTRYYPIRRLLHLSLDQVHCILHYCIQLVLPQWGYFLSPSNYCVDFSSAVRGHHRPPPSKGRTKQMTVSMATAAVQSKPSTQRSIPPSIPSNPPTPGPASRPPTPGPAPSHNTPHPPTPSSAPQRLPMSPVKSQVTPMPSSPHRRKLATRNFCILCTLIYRALIPTHSTSTRKGLAWTLTVLLKIWHNYMYQHIV